MRGVEDHVPRGTGNVGIDTTLQRTIGLFEDAFPGRVRGYYLFGSRMDRSAVATSDIDLVIVIRGNRIGKVDAERAPPTSLAAYLRTYTDAPDQSGERPRVQRVDRRALGAMRGSGLHQWKNGIGLSCAGRPREARVTPQSVP